MKRVPLFLCLLIAVFGSGCQVHQLHYALRCGFLESRMAISAGHPRLKTYGMPAPGMGKYEEILKSEYGVSVDRIAGCMVWPPLEWYEESYNRTTEKYLAEKYGKDVTKEVWDRAWESVPKAEDN